MVTKDATQNEEHQRRLTTPHGRPQDVKPRAKTARPPQPNTQTIFFSSHSGKMPPPTRKKQNRPQTTPYRTLVGAFRPTGTQNRSTRPQLWNNQRRTSTPSAVGKYLQSQRPSGSTGKCRPRLPHTHRHTHKMFPQHTSKVGGCHPNAAIPKTDGGGGAGRPPNCPVHGSIPEGGMECIRARPGRPHLFEMFRIKQHRSCSHVFHHGECLARG